MALGKKKKSAGESPDQISEEKKIQKKKGYSWLNELRYGRSISIEFFKTNAWLLIIIVVVVISLIGLRYKTKTKMAEIKKLNTELTRAQSLKLQEKSAYMSLIRETEMRRMVREKGLSLEFQEQPPYEIIDDGN
ncbi:MAG: hypothetical protein HDS12_02305 [Bacteroides sp.]|nr:hypothetical protein [Bacteroidales bacterium]MBD5301954.1 hypothetical protein [Bacteroides sp.]MBD5205261.1 hypothetical protein [Bacteroidales bacterium]MBD5224208.1 hypothetical protein [Bacteroidales bacterium]MBD5305110.1 hypothetical protein [Bacteroides sp.]